MFSFMFLVYSSMGWFIYIFLFVLGVILGSFLNSWVWRVYGNMRISNGRSVCVHCYRQLRWHENVPLISYFILRRRCHTCGKAIPAHYFFVEFFSGLLLVFIAWYHVNILTTFNQYHFFRDVSFLTFLISILISDIRYRIILSRVIWPGTIIGYIFNHYYLGYSASSLLIGALIGGGFFLAQYLISKGRWIGGGDVRMGVMMGVWLGWPVILVALFGAYISGALVGLGLLLFKKAGPKTEVPFGAFLALGTFCALLHGQMVVDWYLSLLR